MVKLRRIWLSLGAGWVATLMYLSLMPHPPEPMDFYMLTNWNTHWHTVF
jgi:hypothetical protein